MEGFSLSIESILSESVRMGASDTHITVGLPPMIRVDGMLMPLGNQPLTARDSSISTKGARSTSLTSLRITAVSDATSSSSAERMPLRQERSLTRFLHASSWVCLMFSRNSFCYREVLSLSPVLRVQVSPQHSQQ